jgi:type I site-specific restriction endonuclease
MISSPSNGRLRRARSCHSGAGTLTKSGKPDYILYLRRHYAIAVVEAKAEYKNPADGLQQAMTYAEMLQVGQD